MAVIEGGDPLHLTIARAGLISVDPFPYGGEYPCGSLVYKGIWYYGTYALDWYKNPWDIMGPFVGFRISTDFGKTWRAVCNAKNPLFGESGKNGLPVHMICVTEDYQKSPFSKAGKRSNAVKIGAPLS